MAKNKIGYFDLFCVSPQVRETGIGKQLISESLKTAKKLGCSMVFGTVKHGDTFQSMEPIITQTHFSASTEPYTIVSKVLGS